MCGERFRKLFSRYCGCLLQIRMAPSSDGLRTPRFWQCIVAEATGTLLLVLIGCGSWMQASGHGPDYVRISFTFAALYAILMYCLRHISGAHMNPAVTIAALTTRQVSLLRAILYIVAQCLGSIIGAALLLGFQPSEYKGPRLGASVPQGQMSAERAFAVEFIATLFFVLVVTACKDRFQADKEPRIAHPFVIGLALLAAELYAVPLSGGSLNPARSLGPAICGVVWKAHWIYWFAPILGGMLGAVFYEFVFATNASFGRIKSCMLANEANKEPKNKPQSMACLEKGTQHSCPPEALALRTRPTPSPDLEDEDIPDADRPDSVTIEKT